MNKIVKDIITNIEQDSATYYADYKKIYEEVAKSKAVYKGEPVPFLYIPKVFTEVDLLRFETITKDIFKIVNKSIDLYMENKMVREYYGFDKRLDELIRKEHDFSANVPMGRFDIFYNMNGEFKFCELNTDGTSAMNEDFVLSQIMAESKPMVELSEAYNVNSFELYHTWVKEVKAIYRESGGKKEKPFVAIVDFIDKASSIEFDEFKARFTRDDCVCDIVDPRKIEEVDGELYFNDKRIDVIYRRLVTKDLMDRYDEILPLIEGLKAGKTCVIGPIKSQIVHTKKFFEVLHNDEIRKLFTEEELAYIDEHIPYTKKLVKDKSYDTYIDSKDKYIIKPTDYYASKGVYSGMDHSRAEWIKILDDAIASDYIIQEYCDTVPTDNVLFDEDGGVTVKKFSNITGLFVYNEKFYGLYSRAGKNSIISGIHDGYTLPSFVAVEK